MFTFQFKVKAFGQRGTVGFGVCDFEKRSGKQHCYNNGDAVTYCGDGMIWDREEGKNI